MDEDAGLPKVIEFMKGWARELPYLEQLLIVRYEDLRGDTGGQLRRVLEFMGQSPTDSELADCVESPAWRTCASWREEHLLACRLAHEAGRQGQPGLLQGAPRAKVGGYRDYFDDQQAARLDAMTEERLLPGFGYSPPSTSPPAPAAVPA